MIQKKGGFTLIELMAVIVILALIITIAASSVSGVMKRAKDQTAEEIRANLKEVGITYALSKYKLQKCSESFSKEVYENKNIAQFSSNTNCAIQISVSELKAEGLFEDAKKYCLDTDTVMIYRYNVEGNSEYKAYVSDTACTNY